MKDKKILVTGAGGDIGLSILKILGGYTSAQNLYCADISEDNVTPVLYNNFFVLPTSSDKHYLTQLELAVQRYGLDLIVPTSENELRFFSQNSITEIFSAKIVLPNQEAMNIGFSKFATAAFLKENQMLAPWTIQLSELPPSFPCIVKSDGGWGSKDLFIVQDEEEYNFYKKRKKGHIAQEYLAGDEYTCGLYRTLDGEVYTLIFKRELKGGLTGKGLLVRHTEIENLLHSIANKINLRGSINVQLRLTEKGPMVFEINPRFSSTVLFREKLGFHDLVWSIQERLGNKIIPYVPLDENVKIYRVYDEVIDVLPRRNQKTIQAKSEEKYKPLSSIRGESLIGELAIRPATLEDAHFILDVANDPFTRVMSFSQDPIAFDEHIVWLSEQLDKNTPFYIATSFGEPCGYMRFDVSHEIPVVSIALHKKYRRQGLGKEILSLACEQFFKDTIFNAVHAHIKSYNIASIKVFGNVGFTYISSPDDKTVSMQYLR